MLPIEPLQCEKLTVGSTYEIGAHRPFPYLRKAYPLQGSHQLPWRAGDEGGRKGGVQTGNRSCTLRNDLLKVIKAVPVGNRTVRTLVYAIPAKNAPLRDDLNGIPFHLDRLSWTYLDTIGTAPTLLVNDANPLKTVRC